MFSAWESVCFSSMVWIGSYSTDSGARYSVQDLGFRQTRAWSIEDLFWYHTMPKHVSYD